MGQVVKIHLRQEVNIKTIQKSKKFKLKEKK